MTARQTTWDGPPPDRAAIEGRFRDEGLSPHGWGNGPGDRYGRHAHDYDKVLYCVSGGITFQTDAGDFDLRRQIAELELVTGSPIAAKTLADNYTGLPLG